MGNGGLNWGSPSCTCKVNREGAAEGAEAEGIQAEVGGLEARWECPCKNGGVLAGDMEAGAGGPAERMWGCASLGQ